MSLLRGVRFGCLLLFCLAAQIGLAGNLPPVPARYVEDKAGLLSPADADSLNSRLAGFERETSNQLVVAIYPSLPEGAELAQFSTETFESWGVGQKKQDNGVVLFIFPKDRKMFIATGRGLEGALPDATCKTIITQEITPRFRQSDYAGGINAAVDAIMAASKGEYQGSGQTQAEARGRSQEGKGIPLWAIVLIIVIFMIISKFLGRLRPVVYSRGGSRTWSSGSGWGGGGWGGGGGGGSSGGFSGGGGGTSGGGAGGSW